MIGLRVKLDKRLARISKQTKVVVSLAGWMLFRITRLRSCSTGLVKSRRVVNYGKLSVITVLRHKFYVCRTFQIHVEIFLFLVVASGILLFILCTVV